MYYALSVPVMLMLLTVSAMCINTLYTLLNTIYCNINLLNVYVCIYILLYLYLLLLYSIYIIKHICMYIMYVYINPILPLEILPLVIEMLPLFI